MAVIILDWPWHRPEISVASHLSLQMTSGVQIFLLAVLFGVWFLCARSKGVNTLAVCQCFCRVVCFWFLSFGGFWLLGLWFLYVFVAFGLLISCRCLVLLALFFFGLLALKRFWILWVSRFRVAYLLSISMCSLWKIHSLRFQHPPARPASPPPANSAQAAIQSPICPIYGYSYMYSIQKCTVRTSKTLYPAIRCQNLQKRIFPKLFQVSTTWQVPTRNSHGKSHCCRWCPICYHVVK